MNSSISRRRVLELSTLIAPLGASAQKTSPSRSSRSPRVGILWLGRPSTLFGPNSRELLFRTRLGQLGWSEGRDLTIESRFLGEGADVPGRVEEFLAMKVDVIVAMASPIAVAVKHMTSSVPVVFVAFGDPVDLGLIDSLARPGHNLTGVYMPTAEHAGKRLGLLHDAVPGSARIAVLDFLNPRARREFSITQAAAEKLGVQLIEVRLTDVDELDAAFLACKKEGASALSILADQRISINLRKLAGLSLAYRLPSIAGYTGYAWLGGFMAYGADGREGIERAAYFVARILDGARPADLPVEQTTKYLLALNARTAKRFGLSFPKPLVLYADFVVS
ncbi:ABC transporter substrate-binding protein [Variovorax sp. GT1P44]|uniref:ABC transporter substrate-binding protein n=1 Tax=Variovorax sp. GT1P44 TaxID=3443742 RepID=UPI003F45EC86